MKYKICYVTTLPVTLKAFVLKSALYNSRKGDWDITFICNETAGFAEELPPEIKYLPVTLKRGISLSGFRSVFQLYRIFRNEKFDLVQYSTSNAGCYASIAAKLAGIPIRLYCQWGLDYPAFSGLKRIMFETIERVICILSTNVQPDSYGNLEIAIKDHLYGDEKGMVIGSGSASGVDLKKFDFNKKPIWRKEIRKKLAICETDIVIGYVGRLIKDKGINELFLVMKSIMDANRNVYLLLVGDTSTEGINEKLNNWAQNEDRVLFTGFTNEVEKYYSAMDIFVLPSYHEGFGTSVIEAEAMGVPVVVSDIPGPREGAKKDITGFLVPAKDTSALYNKLGDLINNNDMRIKMGNNGRKHAISFDQEYLFSEIFKNREMLLKSIDKSDD